MRSNLRRLIGMDELEEALSGMGYEEEGVGGYGADIVGDELAELMGEEVQPIRVRSKGLRTVRNVQLRRYPLGLGATIIGPGATAIISANPQLPFRVDRLVTPSTGLLIDNLQVGTVSQFVAAGAVPTEVFAPNAFGVALKGDTAVPGVSVQITVSNPTGAPLTFSGAIIGSVAQ